MPANGEWTTHARGWRPSGTTTRRQDDKTRPRQATRGAPQGGGGNHAPRPGEVAKRRGEPGEPGAPRLPILQLQL